MEGIFSTLIYAALLLFLIIELGLTAYLVKRTDGDSSRFNFQLFNAVFTFVIIAYTALVKRVISSLYHALVGLAVLALAAVFWFAGSIALAAKVPVRCRGFHDCQVTQAAVAFGFFIWAIVTVLAAFEGLSSRGGGAGGSRV